MEDQLQNSSDKHKHHPLSDEATRNKIEKHLSDENDTISEEDIKNINTDIPGSPKDTDTNKDERDIVKPKKEMPNTWDMIDE